MLKRKPYDKASIDSNSHPQHTEYIRNLVYAVTQRTGPSNADIPLQERSQTIKYSVCKRQDENIVIRKLELDKMRGNHLANRVRIYETGEEDEGDKMVIEDFGVEI